MKIKKKGNSRNMKPSGDKWEAVPIDEDFISDKEFENLISFEVLHDYTIVRKEPASNPADDEGSSTQNDLKVNTKRKLKGDDVEKISKKNKLAVPNEDCEEATDDEYPQIETNNSADLVVFGAGSQTPWVVTESNSFGSDNSIKPIEKSNKGLVWSPGSSTPWVVTEKVDADDDDDHVSADLGESDPLSETSENVKKPQKKKEKKPKTRKQKALNRVETASEAEDDEVNYTEKMSSWVQLGVPTPVLKALYEKNFEAPTTIQMLTLPSAILGRKDIVGAAETGSGKTLAFAIPIIDGILKSRDEAHGLQALIITPTRELAVQIKNHIMAAAKYTDIQVVVIVGGLASQKQERLLRKQPEIVIATPGRLWELVQEGNPHLSTLSSLKYLAVDETDRMVEKGHFQELEGIIGNINSDPEAVQKRQNFVFSATLSFIHEAPHRLKNVTYKSKKMKQQPKQIDKKEKMKKIMELIGVKENAKIVDITKKKGTCETLTEMQITCQLAHKDYYLYYFFVRHPGRCIVFCNSINCVRRLTNLFFLLNCDPIPLHSEMQQKQRLRSLERFVANDRGILIATDVAARGLDIVDIQHVIHYQVPKSAESYIHRSGRTARAFKGGLAVLLVEPSETTLVQNIMKSLERGDAQLPLFDVDGEIYRDIKVRIDMAVKVETFEHQVRKKLADMNWMERSKKEMDLASSDEDSEEDVEYMRGSKGLKCNLQKAKKELDGLKQKLADLLSVNLYTMKRGLDVPATFKKIAGMSTTTSMKLTKDASKKTPVS